MGCPAVTMDVSVFIDREMVMNHIFYLGDIQSTGGIGNALFGGEGLFNTKVMGPGKIWLQTMPLTSLAGSLQPLLASKN